MNALPCNFLGIVSRGTFRVPITLLQVDSKVTEAQHGQTVPLPATCHVAAAFNLEHVGAALFTAFRKGFNNVLFTTMTQPPHCHVSAERHLKDCYFFWGALESNLTAVPILIVACNFQAHISRINCLEFWYQP